MKLWIPEDRLSHHTSLTGAPGTRKSSIARLFAYQAINQGWPCVFLDLKGEYFRELYQEGIDYLIDFADERCVRWMIGREALDEISAMPIGTGAFPQEPGRQFFFQDHAQAIFAYVVGNFHPPTSELARILANPSELDKLVVGTEHASTLSQNSAEQRNGILGTLNHIGRALRWMPDDDGRRQFCAREWAAMGPTRKGSIFLRSSALTFDALRPMQALILDLILLGLEQYPGPCLLILDEAGRFPPVPQLDRSMNILRGSGNPIVLVSHGFSEFEEHYGEKRTENILSAPYTNVVFRTGGEKSAKYASALLGLPAEVWRERRSSSGRMLESRLTERITESEEKVMESPVLPGEVQCQEDGHGWMAQAGKIVKIHVDYLPAVTRVEPLKQRLIPNFVLTPPNEKPKKPNRGNSSYTHDAAKQDAPKPYKSRYTAAGKP